MVSISFKQGDIDPCLVYKKNELGINISVLYIDDCLLVGKDQAIESTTKDIKKMFNVTLTREATEYSTSHTCTCILKVDLKKLLILKM